VKINAWDERKVYSVWKLGVPHAIRRGLTERQAWRFVCRQPQDYLYRVKCDVPQAVEVPL